MTDIFRPFSHKQNVFEVATPDRTYYIQADSEPEMMEWIKAFKHVIRSIKGRSTVVSSSFGMFDGSSWKYRCSAKSTRDFVALS